MKKFFTSVESLLVIVIISLIGSIILATVGYQNNDKEMTTSEKKIQKDQKPLMIVKGWGLSRWANLLIIE